MTFSLNEIEAMGKRAARGAGLPWGLAEEAGKAARWLTARGLPGPRALADILTRNDGKAVAEVAPITLDPIWCAPSGRLCPLVTGAAISDRAQAIAAGEVVQLGPTAQPLLLAPFAHGAAELTDATVELSWAGVALVLTPRGFSFEGSRDALTARSADGVRCRRRESTARDPSDPTPGRDVDAETWSRLNTFALRTFAPATESSRLTGAGAGLRDND